ncbi:hypothetical protein M747DRAFT_267006 [Aspergillus niger ATCC 13496]|uniref:Uncharacterized protein n=1 Tax=Aspergillus niger ATCC 13496 TaxID=1353008 RepID=A0A370BRV9_ASPNG|nr:hypothetical protein M747DRAFT_267006 [Aspergillus niger ATCC 13496]
MTFAHNDYMVAWICALSLELAAAKAILDEVHPPLSQPASDHNVYTLGRIGSHNVIVACLPGGVYGTISATAVASHMVSTFRNIRFGLMVGIGGGVPSQSADIRLGDVVVSMPTATSGGVIQFDYGKTLRGGHFQHTGLLNKPPPVLLKAISQVKSDYMTGKRLIGDILNDTLQNSEELKEQFSRPKADWLFSPTYDHDDSKYNCLACDQTQLVNRPERRTDDPCIHYGLIASGDQVMKDAKTRDFIARDLDILCFEMEAAGLMDELPSLVIRGICDYCDSHKNKRWQGYAALTAAAYAKALLSVVPATLSRERDLCNSEKECLRSLSFREQEYRYNDIHPAMHTCAWLFEDPQYKAWLNSRQGLLWIKGNPGAGKSVLMKFAVQSMADKNAGKLVSFFIHGRGTTLQRTPLGLFRALLNAMLCSFPDYLCQLTQSFVDREKRYGSYEEGRWTWPEEELRKLLSQILTEGTKNSPVIVFIDALDECGKDSARTLLTYFKDLMEAVKCKGGQAKICLSSRHYPILGHHMIPSICMEQQNTNDIQRVVGGMLKEIEAEEDRKYFESEVLSKARGGFQWAVLVCNRVIEENIIGTKREDLRSKLADIPEALDGLYSRILNDVHESDRQQMVKLFQWILFAKRPLSAHELRDALSIDIDMEPGTQLRSHSSWSDTVTKFEVHVRHLSKGLVEFQSREIWEQYEPGEEDSDREAQFIHQSVADFLLNKFLSSIMCDPHLSQSVVGAGHFQISRACLRYMTHDEVLEGGQRLSRSKFFQTFQLIPYAVRFLFQHIKEVEQQNIPQSDLLTLLHWGQKSTLQKLANLWRVSDPDNVYTPRGWPFIQATAFHVLITFASKSAFDDLLQNDGVEVDGRDIDGNTPLLLAIKRGHQDMAVALLNRSIEWQLHQKEVAVSAIIYGTSTKRDRYYFMDVNARDNENNTALSVAMEESALDVMVKLIEGGASFNIQDSSGWTPLTWASEGGHEAVAKLLLEQGADPNTQDSSGQIPLASWRGHEALAKLLLEQGADPNTQDSSGWTPLTWASERGHEAVAKLLLQYRADPNSGYDLTVTQAEGDFESYSIIVVCSCIIPEPVCHPSCSSGLIFSSSGKPPTSIDAKLALNNGPSTSECNVPDRSIIILTSAWNKVQTTANIRAFEEGDPHYYTTSSETSSQRQAVQVQDSQGADIPNDSDGTESELEFHVDEYRDEIYEDMSKPVLFYGKDNQLEDVITYCTLRFLTDDAFDDNDKRKSAYLGTLLRGPALRWLSKEQSVDPEIYDDYQEFVKKVRTAFAKTEKTKIQEASRRITFLTQKSSVQAYYVAFQRDAEELS